jgi:prepilin-type N-terminal cleavage/methylation domain-containing protein
MKITPLRRPGGFTLVELLVVIAIVAVLAGVGFSAGNAAIQRARKTTALATATAIESAVNNFFNDYSSMPTDKTEDTVFESNNGDGLDLIKVLLGQESDSADPMYNPKKIKFLTVKEGKRSGQGGVDGLVYNQAGDEIIGLFDPWGGDSSTFGRYNIMLDCDYDEKLEIRRKAAGAGTEKLNGRRVAVWSDGYDGRRDGDNGKMNDDVTTWAR